MRTSAIKMLVTRSLERNTELIIHPFPHLAGFDVTSLFASAVGMAIKSVLSDTTLIVTGTVVAMALRLGVEEDSPPRRLAGSMLSLLGGPLLDWDGSGDKEL